MKNIENYMVLTEASYTDFFGLELSADNKSKIEKAIKDEGDDNGKTKSGIAKYIADRYNVIDHCTDENHPASTDRRIPNPILDFRQPCSKTRLQKNMFLL